MRGAGRNRVRLSDLLLILVAGFAVVGPISVPLHGQAAAQCVAIEDSRWGLDSARAAGLRTVAVTTTYRTGLVADVTIASLEAMDLDQLARLCSE